RGPHWEKQEANVPSVPSKTSFLLSSPYQQTVCEPITGGLCPRKSITISGKVLSNSDRFNINLKSGNDIAFHLNPRFDENVIVRNSFLNQTWGTEERDMPGKMPLARGQDFTIRILCQDHCFKVAVNEQDQFEYQHRVQNLQQIDKLEITGLGPSVKCTVE
uniref:Galectin n=1 Tax=Crocodylus porosus TaxID=8502 RepID=A0A7M4FWS4_CROPO